MTATKPTKKEVADAIREAVKRRYWGNAACCPLCELFSFEGEYGYVRYECFACRDAVFSGVSCCDFTPVGTGVKAEEYWNYEIDPKKRGPWRRAANRELLAIADRLEREHEEGDSVVGKKPRVPRNPHYMGPIGAGGRSHRDVTDPARTRT